MRIENVLHAVLFTPMSNARFDAQGTVTKDRDWGLPVLFESEPGTGKSSIAAAIVERYGFHAEVLSPSERGDGAFGVVPVPQKRGSQTYITYPAPEYAADMEDAFGAAMIVDEVTTAMPHLQAALLGLIGSRRIGNHRFSGKVRVFGLCNPVELAANGSDLAPPLANRFGWIKWDAPTGVEHASYLSAIASDSLAFAPRDGLAEEARVVEAWARVFPGVAGVCGAFHTRKTDWKNRCPKPNDPVASRAWPSDRTWEYAARAMASAQIHNLSSDDRDALCAGFVGAAAWNAFTGWLRDADLPDAADVLDKKAPFTHDPERLDRTLVVLGGAVGLLAGKNPVNAQARARTFWEIATSIGDATLDVVKGPADAVQNAGLLMPEAAKILGRLNTFRNLTIGA